MPLKLNSTGGGSVTVDVPSTASTFTATLPARTGTVITSADTATVTQGMIASGVGGTGPAFSAYSNSGTSLSNGTYTKLAFQVEDFDTASCYDNTTNYRFTPNVAGYYIITSGSILVVAGGVFANVIYKNGSPIKSMQVANSSGGAGPTVSSVVYLNGTTDYVEIYAIQTSGSTQTVYIDGVRYSYFSGALVRAA